MEDAGEGYAKVGGQVYFHGEAVGTTGGGAVQNVRGGYACTNSDHAGGDLYYMGKHVASNAKAFDHINDDWMRFHQAGNGKMFMHRGQQMSAEEAYKAGCPGVYGWQKADD